MDDIKCPVTNSGAQSSPLFVFLWVVSEKVCTFAANNNLMDTVKIDIELPSCGYYSKEELTDLIYSYALSLVMPDSVSDMSVEDELKELKRRAAEMENDPSVCIPHEEGYDRVMSRLHRYETHLA